jgi:hypothetical protein
MSKDPAAKQEMIYGMLVDVMICRPSRRKASSSVQRKNRRVKGKQQGALYVARERGQIDR